jgi:hypothetical protein
MDKPHQPRSIQRFVSSHLSSSQSCGKSLKYARLYYPNTYFSTACDFMSRAVFFAPYESAINRKPPLLIEPLSKSKTHTGSGKRQCLQHLHERISRSVGIRVHLCFNLFRHRCSQMKMMNTDKIPSPIGEKYHIAPQITLPPPQDQSDALMVNSKHAPFSQSTILRSPPSARASRLQRARPKPTPGLLCAAS